MFLIQAKGHWYQMFLNVPKGVLLMVTSKDRDCLDLGPGDSRSLQPPSGGRDLEGDYEDLLSRCPGLEQLDDIADRLGQLPTTVK